MTITKENYNILKAAALLSGADPLLLKAITETETAEKEHNKKMIAYIQNKRKLDKNYCR